MMLQEIDEVKIIVDLVQDIMYDMEMLWVCVVWCVVMYCFYGYSVQEWIVKRCVDGLNGIFDIVL